MRVNSRVTLNHRLIRRLDRAAVVSLEQTAEAVHTDVVQAQVIPRDSGNLQENTFCDYSRSGSGIVQIVSQNPYARRLYYHPEYNFSTAENTNARGRWYDDWINGDKKDFAEKTFAALYRRNSGL